MPLHNKSMSCGHLVFEISAEVYEPAEDTFLMVDHLNIKANDSIIDLGTGCGILGILSASHGAQVIATDLNPWAIRCAKQNARSNRLHERMNFIRGDLFRPIREDRTFDTILFNPPYLPVESKEDDSWLHSSWAGGTTGREVIDRFIQEAPAHLKPDGSIFTVQSSLSGIEATVSAFKKERLTATIIARQDCPFFETLFLLRVKHALS